MPNRRSGDHIGAYNFRIEINGVTQGPVTFVSGLGAKTEVIPFKDGADRIVRLRPGRSQSDKLIVQRGYTNTDELFNWYEATRNGTVERKSGSVILFGDDATSEISRFNFFEAWPCRWTLLPLDAEEGTTLVEEIEIAVEWFEKG